MQTSFILKKIGKPCGSHLQIFLNAYLENFLFISQVQDQLQCYKGSIFILSMEMMLSFFFGSSQSMVI